MKTMRKVLDQFEQEWRKSDDRKDEQVRKVGDEDAEDINFIFQAAEKITMGQSSSNPPQAFSFSS